MKPIEPPPSRYDFPDPRVGKGEHGVVALGGDFAPGTVLAAYRKGIFPWPMPPGVVAWCSPNPRAILRLDEPRHFARSLRRTLRRSPFRITVDRAFADVMRACGDRPEGTWITPELTKGYRALHELGWAHSLEVWSPGGELVGGIYGIAVGAYFSAESMFHRVTDASKIAFAHLVERLAPSFAIFDAQVPTPHLASLGVIGVRRGEFLARHAEAIRRDVVFPADTR